MAVAFVAGGTQSLASGGGTTVTQSVTCGSGSDRLLTAFVDMQAGPTPGAATYNGVGMTLQGTSGSITLFTLVAPASGANNLVVSVTTSDNVGLSWADFTGVDQTTPVGTPATGSGTSTAPATASITVPTDGAAVGQTETAYTSVGTTLTGSGSTTVIAYQRNPANGQVAGNGYRTSTGALTWTLSQSRAWNAYGFPINPSAAAAASMVPVRYGAKFTNLFSM